MAVMTSSTLWRSRWRNASLRLLDFLAVIVICLLSELGIWGLSRVLAPADLEFFASIMGMLLLFCLMTVAGWIWPSCDGFYRHHIRSKVNFINAHLGIGFLIPIVTLSQSNILGGHDIACIIGTFASSNAASWTAVFLLSLLVMMGIRSLEARTAGTAGCHALPGQLAVALSRRMRFAREAMSSFGCRVQGPMVSSSSSSTTAVSETTQHLGGRDSTEQESASVGVPKSGAWSLLMGNCTFILLICGIFAVGLPVTLATGDERLLDGFVLCFLWISAVRLQHFLRTSSLLKSNVRVQGALATLMHPILTTTLLMVAYTRGKAAAMGHSTMDRVLKTLSSGTPLHSIWTSQVTGVPIPDNPSAWFGAGDGALSLLECGMVAWGFKLYECRGQLFSKAGVLTTMLCVGAAAGNVFLAVLIARGIGLHAHEALAFAARSVTLALAKLAVHALGGSVVVNATLVVSNGTLGQLVYPFVLDRLGVKRDSSAGPEPATGDGGRAGSFETLAAPGDAAQLPRDKLEGALRPENRDRGSDDAVTVAAGVAIGINGAAMGVSYLYETGSRAAPYAALSMTVFGVMTVVFMTVEPFKGLVLRLAGG